MQNRRRKTQRTGPSSHGLEAFFQVEKGKVMIYTPLQLYLGKYLTQLANVGDGF